MAARTITVNVAPRPYDVAIESGLLAGAGERIAALVPAGARLFIVTNPVVRGKWGSAFERSLKDTKLKADWLEIPDGERMKTMATIENLAGRMLKGGADRGSVVIAFGGGVVGDLAGFLASAFMRGVPVIQVPTTFLAQVDASIGGKTGVNLSAGKNLLGSFHQPLAVFIDPAVLTTLPDREYRAGLFESLKCGVISNAEIFEFMERERDRILARDPATLEWLIAETVQVKARVVAEDEREGGLRRILNFGHTIGHALESETKYKQYLHGEAVAWGMVAATMLSVAMQKTAAPTAQRIIAAVLAYSPLPKVNVRAKSVVKRLAMDKKSRNGVPHFILPVEIGKVEISNEVPPDMVMHALDEVRYLSKWNAGD
jgi:3-dehydroquinate synthase